MCNGDDGDDDGMTELTDLTEQDYDRLDEQWLVECGQHGLVVMPLSHVVVAAEDDWKEEKRRALVQPKMYLKEWCDQRRLVPLYVHSERHVRPKVFLSTLTLNKITTTGHGLSKSDADTKAAEKMLVLIFAKHEQEHEQEDSDSEDELRSSSEEQEKLKQSTDDKPCSEAISRLNEAITRLSSTTCTSTCTITCTTSTTGASAISSPAHAFNDDRDDDDAPVVVIDNADDDTDMVVTWNGVESADGTLLTPVMPMDNPIGQLSDLCRKMGQLVPEYVFKPRGEGKYLCIATYGDQQGSAESLGKKHCKREAARALLNHLRNEPNTETEQVEESSIEDNVSSDTSCQNAPVETGPSGAVENHVSTLLEYVIRISRAKPTWDFYRQDLSWICVAKFDGLEAKALAMSKKDCKQEASKLLVDKIRAKREAQFG